MVLFAFFGFSCWLFGLAEGEQKMEWLWWWSEGDGRMVPAQFWFLIMEFFYGLRDAVSVEENGEV